MAPTTRPLRILLTALLLCALCVLPVHALAEGDEGEHVVLEAPYLTHGLNSVQVVVGGEAHFDAGQAIGEGELTIQWYVTGAGGWEAVPGATGLQFSLYGLTLEDNGRQVKCVVSNGTLSGETNAATVTVEHRRSTKFFQQPSGVSCVDGTFVTFECAATGYPYLHVYWDILLPSGEMRMDVGRGTSFTMRVHTEDNGMQVRASAVNGFYDQANSNWVTVQVLPAQERTAPAIIRHPQDILITGDGTFSSSVQVSGHPEPDITWQVNYMNGGWQDVHSGGGLGEPNGTSFSLTSTWYETYDGMQFRCIARNIMGEAVSNPATAWAALLPAIDTPLGDETALFEENAYFFASCWGYPAIELLWQESADDGATWNNLGPWQTTEVYGGPYYITVKATVANHNKLYRYIARNRFGEVTSNVARLRVHISLEPEIRTHPQSQRVQPGDTVNFFVYASAWPKPDYQWQESMDGGASWRDIAGQTGDAYILSNVKASDSGRQFRCVIYNGVRVISNAAVLTVGEGSGGQAATPGGSPGNTQRPAGATPLVYAAGGGGGGTTGTPHSILGVLPGIMPGPSGGFSTVEATKMLTRLTNSNLHTAGATYRSLRSILPAAFVRSHFLPVAPLPKAPASAQAWLPWLGAGLTLLCVAGCLWVYKGFRRNPLEME